MINAATIRDAHEQCECFTQDRLGSTSNADHPITHQGCRFNVKGLRLAVDCDKCRAYGQNDVRPDLLLLRERDGICEWIVVEIQRTMDRAARPQVEAGLRTLDQNPKFTHSQADGPRFVLFLSKRRVRSQELERLRKPIRSQGKVVQIEVRRCGLDTLV